MWPFFKRTWFIWMGVAVVVIIATFLFARSNVIPSPIGTKTVATVATATPNMSDQPCPVPTATAKASTATTTPAKAIPKATPADLYISIGEAEGTAGSIYYNLAFKNITNNTISLYGYPGVSVLNTSGNEIGSPAARMPNEPVDIIDLRPGSYGYALLRVTDAGALVTMKDTAMSAELRIYIPGSTAPVFLPFKIDAPITSVVFMHISPVNAGSTG